MVQPYSTSSISAQQSDAEALVKTVQQAKEGDHAAFETLYERYKSLIWNYLLYLIKNKESTFDLYQETFLRAWNKLPTLTSNLQFEGWLKQIAIHAALDYLRHEKKLPFQSFPEEDESLLSAQTPSSRFEERVAEKECIEYALSNMAPRNRLCLILHSQWGFSQREIASFLNISEKGVSAYISRGREQFRHLYLQVKQSDQKR